MPGRRYRLRILSPFVLYTLSLLAASWLLLAALGNTLEWDFRPVPPGVDSKALTQAIFDTFTERLWYLYLLFGIFVGLWLIFGLMFWGAVDSKLLQRTAVFMGLLMVAYSIVIPWLVLNPIIEAEWVTAVYFHVAWVLAVTAAVAFRMVAQSITSKSSESWDRFVDLDKSLEAVTGQIADSESSGLLQLRDDANDKLYSQQSRLSGTLFSLSSYPNFVAEAEDAVENFSSALKSSVKGELDKNLGTLDNFSQEAREKIIEWTFRDSPDHLDVVKRYEEERQMS